MRPSLLIVGDFIADSKSGSNSSFFGGRFGEFLHCLLVRDRPSHFYPAERLIKKARRAGSFSTTSRYVTDFLISVLCCGLGRRKTQDIANKSD